MLPYIDMKRKPEHFILHIKEAMNVQSYCNFFKKALAISLQPQ